MAKAPLKKNIQKEDLNNENTIVVNDVITNETNTQEDNVEVAVVQEQKPKNAPERNVKVVLAKNHRCFIGGVWYDFIAGKQYNVPQNVKSILLSCGKLAPM